VEFTAVVNIHNGPGDGALPNPEYSQAIETLNSFHNIRTVGYVATTWCARDLVSVLDDIAAYSFWGEYQDSLAMDGIFVDETPTQYTPSSASYLRTIAQAIHESDGLKEGYIGKTTFSFRHEQRTGLRMLDPPIPAAERLPLHTLHIIEHDICSYQPWCRHPIRRQLYERKAYRQQQFTIQAHFPMRSFSWTRSRKRMPISPRI
jgi:hypothetical protein